MPSESDNTARQELRYRELFRQAPASLQILTPDGKTLRVNKAWEALWQIHEGTDVHAFVLSDYNVLNDPQLVATGVHAYLQRALAGESVEIPAIRYDVGQLEGGAAHTRWVTARAHPIKDEDGAVLEVMLMHEDITERIESESALRIREERFRSLVMATSQIVWTNTPDGRVQEDSPTWRAFTGQTYDEWKELGWLDALHPDDRALTSRLWAHCVATRTVFETEYRLRRMDGSYRWTAVKGVPMVDEEGAVREWIGANRDIHDMVMAQAELAHRLEREKRTSALLAKVAQASRTLNMALSSQDIAAALVAEVRDILQVGKASVLLDEAGDDSGATAAAVSADRLAVPLIDRKGKWIGLVRASEKVDGAFTAEDEAILVQLASIAANGFENARLLASLKEQDRRKDEFLAMLAHELRNPLAPISAAADLLKFGRADEGRVARASEVIGRQVRHMSSLVDDLLDVSRVTRGLIHLERVRVEVGAVVASAVEQARPLLEAREHVLEIDQAPEGAAVIGDANRLVQVLVNLLNNAAKYTPRGGRIALSVAREEGKVCIAVRDNGIGIDTRLLPEVFDLFTQAERTPDRAQGGLGIGLALVRNIVDLHGGTVAAYSQGPGQGSVFTLSLATVPDQDSISRG
jgi:PAS domain S-box-containing protein